MAFSQYVWGFVEGRPIINRLTSLKGVPTETDISKRISKALKADGFRFVGSTTLYAFMQSTGMVNDHIVSCFRHDACAKLQKKLKDRGPRRMTGDNAPRAWQRMLSGRRLDLLSPQPEDIEIEDIAHGLARVARWNGQTIGEHAFSVAQHSLIVTDILAAIDPGFGLEAALRRASARRGGICDR